MQPMFSLHEHCNPDHLPYTRKFLRYEFLLSRKLTGYSQLYFRGSQVHHGEVARIMYCYKSLIVAN